MRVLASDLGSLPVHRSRSGADGWARIYGGVIPGAAGRHRGGRHRRRMIHRAPHPRCSRRHPHMTTRGHPRPGCPHRPVAGWSRPGSAPSTEIGTVAPPGPGARRAVPGRVRPGCGRGGGGVARHTARPWSRPRTPPGRPPRRAPDLIPCWWRIIPGARARGRVPSRREVRGRVTIQHRRRYAAGTIPARLWCPSTGPRSQFPSCRRIPGI